MRVAELTVFVVRIGLRRPFRHAAAAREESVSLIVRCRLRDGTEGWGEGVPRPSLTDETPEDDLGRLAATPLREQLGRPCGNWTDVIRVCDDFRLAPVPDDPRGHRGNALLCAVELSLLDAFGRAFGEPVSEVVRHAASASGIAGPRPSVRYSMTLSADGPGRERLGALETRLFGFRQCKVKVGLAGQDDAARLGRIRRWIGPRIDLRLDANGAWPAEEVAGRMKRLLPYRISCLEQPVPHGQLEALAAVRRSLAVPIMLDESLTSVADAKRAVALGACDLFNIRLSKCGGFLAGLRLASLARSAGLGYQLGCHPGESGILSAAGRHWAASVRDIRYLEGSYDRHLLRERLTKEDMTFGFGGRAPALRAPGLGISVDPDVLAALTMRQACFPVG